MHVTLSSRNVTPEAGQWRGWALWFVKPALFPRTDRYLQWVTPECACFWHSNLHLQYPTEVFKVVHVISVKINITIVVPSSRHKCFQTMTHVYPASKLSGKDQSILCFLILHQMCDERHRSGNRTFVMSQMGLIRNIFVFVSSQTCSSYNKESLLEEGSKLNVFTFCLKWVELQWVDS